MSSSGSESDDGMNWDEVVGQDDQSLSGWATVDLFEAEVTHASPVECLEAAKNRHNFDLKVTMKATHFLITITNIA